MDNYIKVNFFHLLELIIQLYIVIIDYLRFNVEICGNQTVNVAFIKR